MIWRTEIWDDVTVPGNLLTKAEITDTLDASAFSWHRNSGDTAADAEWDAAHVGTKTITVSTEDVTDNASFYCEVTI